ncbi:MAG: type 3-dehydroquinate dehydratase [Bacteroidota bacterium]
MKKIILINGPNLNLLGTREVNIYGSETIESINKKLQLKFTNVEFTFFQSNFEGELVDKIQLHSKSHDGLIINAGAYSHTSVAIADAISAIKIPSVSVHISNIYNRESFRHVDLISSKCNGAIIGVGTIGYEFAVDYILDNK